MTPEQRNTPTGPHHVRIVAPSRAQDAQCGRLYTVEIDGTPIYPESVTVELRPDAAALVRLALPAIVENTEILAALAAETGDATVPGGDRIVPDEVRRLNLEPGERLIVRCTDLTADQAYEYRKHLQEIFPANEVLVLPGDEILVEHVAEPPC